MLIYTCLALFSVCFPSIRAWGSLGHETVAYVATNFVDSETETFFQELLNNDTSSYLASVATWADSYRYTAGGRFSAPFHYIDAADNPPSACGVSYSRDCGEKGCIVAAIQNYTRQILDNDLDPSDRSIAAKFIVHFLGDIHQPLHTEHLNIGGNTIRVNFSGVATNLHNVWDDLMPEKLIGGYSLELAEQWAKELTATIKTGIYKHEAAGWLRGINLNDPVGTALVWAVDSNRLVCSTVLPEGINSVEGKELNGTYYESCVPVIQLQIAKAGYRLAAWLDLIARVVKTEL